jgi:hypothetical protein
MAVAFMENPLAKFPDNRATAHFYFAFYPASRYKTPRAAH